MMNSKFPSIRIFGTQESCRRTVTFSCPNDISIIGSKSILLDTSLQIISTIEAINHHVSFGNFFNKNRIKIEIEFPKIKNETNNFTNLSIQEQKLEEFQTIKINITNTGVINADIQRGTPLFIVSFLCTDPNCKCTKSVFYECECLTFKKIFSHKEMRINV